MYKKIEIGAGLKSKYYWSDLWNAKALFYFFVWRDIIVRYKQTVIGVLWSIIQPILTMLIFVLVFSKVANLPSLGKAPYAIMVFSALIPWQFFANSINQSSLSIINNPQIISKIYFPRIILPISSIFVSIIDFILAFLVLAFMMLIYSYSPTYKLFFLPLFFIMALFFAIGISLICSAIIVKYRDFRMLIPFALQIGIYITPIGFSSEIVPERLRFWYSLNPMVGVVEGFRWAIIGEDIEIYIPGFILSLLLIVIIFLTGVYVFRKMEKTFADII